jgi:hypothetical protein
VQYIETEYWKNGENVSKINFPKSFSEVILNEEAFKLFSTFVTNSSFGCQYIECWNELKLYSEDKDKKRIQKILSFCKENSPNNFLHNPDIRRNIIVNDKLQNNWDLCLEDYLNEVLSSEFFFRFKYSNIWKNYNSHFTKNIDLKFSDVYSTSKVVKEIISVDVKIQHLVVKNKLTNELFRAKKIIKGDEEKKKTSNQVNYFI